MFHQVGSFEFGARSSSNRQCRRLLETSDAALDVHVYHVSNCPPRAVLRTQLHAYFTTAIHRQTASRGQIGSSRRLAQARARASRAQAVAHDVLHQRRQGQALDVVHALEARAGRARGRRRAQHRAAHLRAHWKTRQPDGASHTTAVCYGMSQPLHSAQPNPSPMPAGTSAPPKAVLQGAVELKRRVLPFSSLLTAVLPITPQAARRAVHASACPCASATTSSGRCSTHCTGVATSRVTSLRREARQRAQPRRQHATADDGPRRQRTRCRRAGPRRTCCNCSCGYVAARPGSGTACRL